MSLSDEVWTEDEMMELLGVDRKLLVSLTRTKNLPVVLCGRKRLYLAESVLRWMKENEKS